MANATRHNEEPLFGAAKHAQMQGSAPDATVQWPVFYERDVQIVRKTPHYMNHLDLIDAVSGIYQTITR